MGKWNGKTKFSSEGDLAIPTQKEQKGEKQSAMFKIRIETKTRLPAVLLATRSKAVLNSISQDIFQTREAVSTLGVMSALHADPVLLIVDVDDLSDGCRHQR